MIILASPDPSFEGLIGGLGPRFAEPLSRRWNDDWLDASPIDVVKVVTTGNPDVVMIGPDVDEAIALAWTRSMNAERPDVACILVGNVRPDFVMDAMRAGARDVLADDATDTEVAEALDRAMGTASRIRETLNEKDEKRSRVLCVLSPKGGSGKTTVATNLAYGLARRQDGNTALVDLDIQFGDVSHALQLHPERTIGDAALSSQGGLDLTTLKVFLTPHDSGLYVLCSPDSLIQAEEVSSQHVKKVLSLLSDLFGYVVIDTGAGIDEHALMAMEFATDLILVAACDTASVRAARREIEALDLIGMTTQRRHLVLNRVDNRVGLEPEDVEATLGMDAIAKIPASRGVMQSTNTGQPLLSDEAKDAAMRPMWELVDFFLPDKSDDHERSGWRWGR